jgi:CBS domain-containing protein
MIPRSELKWVAPDAELSAVFDRMTSEDVNQLAVLDGGQLLGMVARDNLLRFIRLRAELGV